MSFTPEELFFFFLFEVGGGGQISVPTFIHRSLQTTTSCLVHNIVQHSKVSIWTNIICVSFAPEEFFFCFGGGGNYCPHIHTQISNFPALPNLV